MATVISAGVVRDSIAVEMRKSRTAKGKLSQSPIIANVVAPIARSGTRVKTAPNRRSIPGADKVQGRPMVRLKKKMIPIVAVDAWSSSWKKTLKNGKDNPVDRPRKELIDVKMARSL